MTCPKCNNQNEGGNFCSNCAEPLKEKCPECGNMEPIGINVCMMELKKALDHKKQFTQVMDDLSRYAFSFSLTTAIGVVVINEIFNNSKNTLYYLLGIFIPFGVIILLFYCILKKLDKRTDIKKDGLKLIFAQKFPVEEEIINKANLANTHKEERK